jgi:4-amino-4-deoxychorismate lyase
MFPLAAGRRLGLGKVWKKYVKSFQPLENSGSTRRNEAGAAWLILGLADFAGGADRLRRPFHAKYYAMFSSVYGGIVTDPVLMMVPIDDHLVHRGDGVFESLKYVNGAVYNFHAHLKRLRYSAGQVGIAMEWTDDEAIDITAQTVRAGGRSDGSLRIIVSRGPGSLTVNPYDSHRPELYVLASAPIPPFMEQHPAGARVRISAVPVKPPFLARIKSCNYLPNVLMKKEAVDAGVDYSVAVDDRGFLAEGPTENVGVVTPAGRLQFPRGDCILSGTTMERALDLARRLVQDGQLAAVEQADIPVADARAAAELLILGTSPDVVAAVELDGAAIGTGKPGPVYRRLSKLLADDILLNTGLRTNCF